MRSLHTFAASILVLLLVSPALTTRPSERFAPHSFVPVRQNLREANVTVAGIVKTPEGRGIKGAYITIRDANTNQVVRAAYSSTFGYYRLEQIETGRTYVLSIAHRRYLFVLPAQLLEINEDRSGVDFIGEPSDD